MTIINVGTSPITADILEFVSGSKNIFDADSDDEKEMNSTTDPSPSQMRNFMKSMRSYLDAHSNGKIKKNG
ncbi:hypothetical protein TNCV_368801 [Trichonephila clavipes]|nr:hypothetical protein TNCV_368801 [Trichonephila clavipes]